MKAAVFTPYLPYPPDTGGKIRSYHLLRALATRFEVDLFTVYDRPKPPVESVEALEEFCHRVILFRLERSWRLRHRVWRAIDPLPRSVHYFHTQSSLQLARQHLRNNEYDVVLADEICMTPYAELTAGIPMLIMRQKIDSIHYQGVAQARRPSLDRALDLLESRQLQRYERSKMSRFQAYLACSEDDATWINLDAPDLSGLVVANGADLSEFTSSGRQTTGEPTLLYVGTMNYYPNIDAVEYYFQDIHAGIRQRNPDVRVHIVGHSPPPEVQSLARLPGVLVTGTVPNVRPYYEEATVLIVPLRLGGGTRLKIIEAMAMGLPVVSTAVGAEGLGITPGENILIADDADSFSDSVSRLLVDSDLRARIAKGGQELARRYDWMELTKPWVELVEKVASKWKQAAI